MYQTEAKEDVFAEVISSMTKKPTILHRNKNKDVLKSSQK